MHRARAVLRASKRVAVLTGAGISAESGLRTFRGPGGLWKGRRPEELATPAAFARDPDLVWEFYRWRVEALEGATPNAAHYALAELESRVDRFWLITQNVDGLHRAAGSAGVIEIHGTLKRARCSVCPFRCDMREAIREPVPMCPECGRHLRPAVVWFGEPLPGEALAAVDEALGSCDSMLVVGTSGVVEPAASFARRVHSRGAPVVEVNIATTPLSRVADISILGKAGEVLPRLVADGAPSGPV